MSYLVFARKYRPQRLDELVGQEHVTQTLQNAFRLGKIAQAYLFTGTRGVGKTSIGRIIAKALRCEDPNSQPGKPNYGIPCNKCSSCLEVGQPGSMDVLEIDGASNNGVDNVREIRESVKFAPSRGRTKVYIIDEVHMLTGAAFNALLKTLEEPPAHAVFILATTEVQKIPATILSRCQRFDLKRVPTVTIADYLGRILLKEEITAEPDSLQMVARKADGSIRDALSLLDQVVANCGKNLDTNGTASALGIIRSETGQRVLQSLLAGDAAKAIEQVQTAVDSGADLKLLATDLAETVRNALLLQSGIGRESLSLLAEEATQLQSLASKTNRESLVAIFQVLNQTVGEMLRSPVPRAVLDVALVRASAMRDLASVQELLTRMDRIEQALGGGAVIGSANVRPMAMAGAPALSIVAPIPSVMAPSSATAAPPSPAAPSELNWSSLVRFATAQKPNIGSLLEHAVPLTPENEWRNPSLAILRIGFRDNQVFQYEQARSANVFSGIEKILSDFFGRPQKASVEKITPKPDAAAQKSINDGKMEKQKARADGLKKKFLDQDIIKETREIFGADVSSFDISSANDSE